MDDTLRQLEEYKEKIKQLEAQLAQKSLQKEEGEITSADESFESHRDAVKSSEVNSKKSQHNEDRKSSTTNSGREHNRKGSCGSRRYSRSRSRSLRRSKQTSNRSSRHSSRTRSRSRCRSPSRKYDRTSSSSKRSGSSRIRESARRSRSRTRNRSRSQSYRRISSSSSYKRPGSSRNQDSQRRSRNRECFGSKDNFLSKKSVDSSREQNILKPATNKPETISKIRSANSDDRGLSKIKSPLKVTKCYSREKQHPDDKEPLRSSGELNSKRVKISNYDINSVREQEECVSSTLAITPTQNADSSDECLSAADALSKFKTICDSGINLMSDNITGMTQILPENLSKAQIPLSSNELALPENNDKDKCEILKDPIKLNSKYYTEETNMISDESLLAAIHNHSPLKAEIGTSSENDSVKHKSKKTEDDCSNQIEKSDNVVQSPKSFFGLFPQKAKASKAAQEETIENSKHQNDTLISQEDKSTTTTEAKKCNIMENSDINLGIEVQHKEVETGNETGNQTKSESKVIFYNTAEINQLLKYLYGKSAAETTTQCESSTAEVSDIVQQLSEEIINESNQKRNTNKSKEGTQEGHETLQSEETNKSDECENEISMDETLKSVNEQIGPELTGCKSQVELEKLLFNKPVADPATSLLGNPNEKAANNLGKESRVAKKTVASVKRTKNTIKRKQPIKTNKKQKSIKNVQVDRSKVDSKVEHATQESTPCKLSEALATTPCRFTLRRAENDVIFHVCREN